MGGHPYYYYVPYRANLQEALEELQEREFEAGRYYPAVMFPKFSHGSTVPPGKQHRSIDEARLAAREEGTRSILDLQSISDEPEFCAASRVPDETLVEIYGTAMPTREMLESDGEVLTRVDRGHGIYVVLYRDEKPVEIFFGGYSFD